MNTTTTLKDVFLNLFLSSSALSVNGYFHNDYVQDINGDSGDPDEVIVDISIKKPDGGCLDFVLTNEDLDSIKRHDNGCIWTVGGFSVKFFEVSVIRTVDENRTYRVVFKPGQYVNNPKPIDVPLSFFNESVGYNPEDTALIDSLPVGDVVELDVGRQTVTRVS
jgi:hypothetical protein